MSTKLYCRACDWETNYPEPVTSEMLNHAKLHAQRAGHEQAAIMVETGGTPWNLLELLQEPDWKAPGPPPPPPADEAEPLPPNLLDLPPATPQDHLQADALLLRKIALELGFNILTDRSNWPDCVLEAVQRLTGKKKTARLRQNAENDAFKDIARLLGFNPKNDDWDSDWPGCVVKAVRGVLPGKLDSAMKAVNADAHEALRKLATLLRVRESDLDGKSFAEAVVDKFQEDQRTWSEKLQNAMLAKAIVRPKPEPVEPDFDALALETVKAFIRGSGLNEVAVDADACSAIDRLENVLAHVEADRLRNNHRLFQALVRGD